MHEIKLLPLIDIELESSFLVLARDTGVSPRARRRPSRRSRPQTEAVAT